jgi:hypothetical protein
VTCVGVRGISRETRARIGETNPDFERLTYSIYTVGPTT